MTNKRAAVDAWESLFRAQVSVMRQLHSEFPTGEISLNEYDVLLNLSKCPSRSLRIRDLGQHLLLSQPSISRLIDRLAARGILAKSNDPHDARGIVVTLTDDGYGLFRRVAVKHMQSISGRLTSSLTDDELVQLRSLTAKLASGCSVNADTMDGLGASTSSATGRASSATQDPSSATKERATR